MSVIATSGFFEASFPSWGRCFWQDPNDGTLFLAYASGNTEVDYIYSSNSGLTWTAPAQLFPVDNFVDDDNFDIAMDREGHIHSVFKLNGSGCYQFTGRVSGGGWTNSSGVGPAGFCDTTTGTNSSRGLHASLYISQGKMSAGGDPAKNSRAARIACKKADQEVEMWYVSHPYNTYPVMHSGVSREGEQAGPLGGYPIIHSCISFGGIMGSIGVAYSASGISLRNVGFPNGSWYLIDTLPIIPKVNSVDNGASGLVPFGPNMAFTSGLNFMYPMMVSHQSGMEMYSTCQEDDNFYNATKASGAMFVRVDSSAAVASFAVTQRRAPFGFPLLGTLPSGNVYGMRGNGLIGGSGTRVDITHCNEQSTYLMYFLGHNNLGTQVVNRIKCGLVPNSPGVPKATQFDFSSLGHMTSGIKEIAIANAELAGGHGNIAYWKGFKALKHPTAPNEGRWKKELIATIGSPATYPSGASLNIWDFEESVGSQETFHYTTYDYNYLATSGTTAPVFKGMPSGVATSGLQFALDKNINTWCVIRHNSEAILEFAKPVQFTRMEIAYNNSPLSNNRFPGALISGSMDGVNWSYLHTMSSGYFGSSNPSIKLACENPLLTGNERIQPWACKYLKLHFLQNQKTGPNDYYYMTELLLYGPGQLKGPVILNGATSNEQQYVLRPEASRFTQRFDTTREGQLPGSGWRTYGNWEWKVRASGSWSRIQTHGTPPQNGLVASGSYTGSSNGNGDGFALIPNEDVPPLTSGVVEVDVIVYPNETSRVSGLLNKRTISLDYRVDFPASDDKLDVYYISPAPPITSFNQTLIRKITNTTPSGWTTMDFQAGVGSGIMRLIYTRGATTGNFGHTGQVWIDNIIGLNGPPQPSIGGFMDGDVLPVSGNINGFMSGVYGLTQTIYGYMSGSPLYSVIYGVINAVPVQSGAIHGYMSASKAESIHGYMAGSGTNLYGSIKGIIGPTGYTTGSPIYGWMRGDGPSNSIHGYIQVESGVSSVIYGFMSGVDNTNRIYGYMFARATESGAINGYIPSMAPFGSIYGYMGNNALSPSGGGTIAGGPGNAGGSTSGVEPTNWINGYMKGADGFEYIHGYIEGPPGGTSYIYGLISVGGSTSIYGFFNGSTQSSGVVNAYMSGVGLAPSQINGFVYGISGIISESINGYIAGVQTPSGNIYGFLTGIPSGLTSLSTCTSHGNIPLPSVLAAVIPTGLFI